MNDECLEKGYNGKSREGAGMSGWRETEFGQIPSDWNFVSASVYCEKVTDGTHDSPKQQISGKHLITSKHIKGRNIDFENAYLINESDYKKINERSKVDQWDVIISMIGEYCGFSYIERNELIDYVVKNVGIFKTGNKDKAFWLHYYVQSKIGKSFLENLRSGTSQPYISLGALREFPVLVPGKIEEQKAIAAVLSSLDDKIDLLHRQNQTLEAISETQFRQWFIEEAQEDWEEGTLGEVVEIFDGQRIPLSRMERDKKKDGILYPYYGAAQIMDYINDFIFDGEYILLGEDGTVRTDEGYPVLQYATGKFWVNNHTHVLKAKAPYSNFFLWNYLSKKNIDEIITGAVQPKINQGNLKSLVFPRFPQNLVIEFNEITEPVLAKTQHNKTQIAGLEKLRDNLLPKLMSGEVRVIC